MNLSSVSRRTLLAGMAAAGAVAMPTAAEAVGTQGYRRFHRKVVVITGATSGIGRMAAFAFAAEGARVGFCGRRANLGHEVAEQIRRAGGEAMYVQADVRHEDQVKAFVDQVVARYGGLDIAFNNAGIGGFGPPHELTAAHWDDVNDTNARGVFFALKHEVPHMLRAGRGVIICTSSSAAERARPDGAAYSASKAAILGLVRAAALAYGAQGIRVNAILPGTTDTPFFRPPGIPDPLWQQFLAAYGPLNVSGIERVATADEIASAVLGLASPDFAYLNGATVLVDGGEGAGRKRIMPPGFPAP